MLEKDGLTGYVCMSRPIVEGRTASSVSAAVKQVSGFQKPGLLTGWNCWHVTFLLLL
jgi:hypothetical protein